MCGLSGIFAKDLPAGREAVVQRMLERLAHRGPDDRGVVRGKGFVLGHTRLAIIDPEHGRQPMETADGRCVLALNGEIYNYLELRRELESAGERFRTNSDTEILLALLAREGEKAVEKLDGMFAFAFYDRSKRELLLARDPFGVKPLYYSVTPSGELVFASEIKALLAHPEIPARRFDVGLRQYLTFQFCLGETTIFEGIRRLEPGALLRWSPEAGIRTRKYWDLEFRIDESRKPEDFLEELQNLLEDSVRLQLRSDVPLGAHLSGGLDSSLVATLASRLSGRRLFVFHGRFAEGPRYDESAHARRVAEHCGADYRETIPSAEDFVRDLPKLVYHMDEPAGGPGLFPQYRVSALAARHVKVVLGGQGGDEMFGGYARYLVGYLEQALKGAIFETQEEGRHLVTLASIVPNLSLLKEYGPLMQQFWREGLFEPMDARYFRLIDRSPDLERHLQPEALGTGSKEEVFAAFREIFNRPQAKSYINRMTHFDLKTLLPALLQIEDRVSMAVSIESRVPLLDVRIAELVAAMPPAVKFAGGRTKFALKQAARKWLPRETVERKDKMGFPVPLSEWLRGKGPVREFVGDVLLGKRSRERGLFRPEAMERLIAEEVPFGRELWGMLCLELWHRTFLDPR